MGPGTLLGYTTSCAFLREVLPKDLLGSRDLLGEVGSGAGSGLLRREPAEQRRSGA